MVEDRGFTLAESKLPPAIWQDFADLPQSVQKMAVQFVMKANQCRSIENTEDGKSEELLVLVPRILLDHGF